MFRHAFQYLFATLVMLSVASCSVLPHGTNLERRQGGCLSAMVAPNPVNNVGRISFQRIIDEMETASWHPSNLVDVHISVADDVISTQNIQVTITNRSSRGNAVIFTNFRDTLPSTAPRAQVRVTVPGQTRGNGLVRVGRREECVHLPRLDGTWYFQIEN